MFSKTDFSRKKDRRFVLSVLALIWYLLSLACALVLIRKCDLIHENLSGLFWIQKETLMVLAYYLTGFGSFVMAVLLQNHLLDSKSRKLTWLSLVLLGISFFIPWSPAPSGWSTLLNDLHVWTAVMGILLWCLIWARMLFDWVPSSSVQIHLAKGILFCAFAAVLAACFCRHLSGVAQLIFLILETGFLLLNSFLSVRSPEQS